MCCMRTCNGQTKVVMASIGANCGFDNNRREGDYRKPSEHISFADTWGGGQDPRISPIHCAYYHTAIDGASRSCSSNVCPTMQDAYMTTDARHNGGVNCGYFDGHVKWNKTSAIYPAAPGDHSKDEMWGLGLRP
jgi:prepilin-type processing-associated H-X9-DG protein